MSVYNDELQINLHFVPVQWFWPSYFPWTLKFGQIFSGHYFISLWFEILTWYLVWECIIISYRSTFKFICYPWPITVGLLNIHGGDIRVVLTHLV